MHSTLHGPDRATFKHWLDRSAKPVIHAAAVLRSFRARFGAPCAINKEPGCAHYVWHSGFDRFSVTVFSRR